MSYTIILDEGVVLRDSDGVQVAPCQSVDDVEYRAYIAHIDAGGQVTQVASRRMANKQVPDSVSLFQMRAALWQMGVLDDVNQRISLDDVDALVKMAWEGSPVCHRDSELVSFVSGFLEFTSDQMDDVFFFAATIRG